MTRGALPIGTKREILDSLLKGERTAEALAERLSVSATAVRQHLAALVSAGLVERRTAETTAGRPAYLYRLTESGRRLYPTRHGLLLRELVEALVERHGRDWTLTVLADLGRAHAAAAAVELAGRAEPGGRTNGNTALAWLEEEFRWEADVDERVAGGRRLVLHQCPFRAVSVDDPEVCGAYFSALLGRLLRVGPVVHAPIRDGIRCCALEIGANPAPAASS